MAKTELETRTKVFALDLIDLVERLPKNRAADVVGRQLLRSGTSIGANYREANRGESRADFIHKLGISTKESAETDAARRARRWQIKQNLSEVYGGLLRRAPSGHINNSFGWS
jgi:four helix bundle protein